MDDWQKAYEENKSLYEKTMSNGGYKNKPQCTDCKTSKYVSINQCRVVGCMKCGLVLGTLDSLTTWK